MHEQDFNLLEGRSITLPELGREIESITGRQIKDSTGEIKRVIAHLPNFESDTDSNKLKSCSCITVTSLLFKEIVNSLYLYIHINDKTMNKISIY
jgi:hypothetical protein